MESTIRFDGDGAPRATGCGGRGDGWRAMASGTVRAAGGRSEPEDDGTENEGLCDEEIDVLAGQRDEPFGDEWIPFEDDAPAWREEEAGFFEHPAARSFDRLSAHEVGAMGEMLAGCFLEQLGYDVLEHGYRCPEGEADLIAFDPSTEEIVLVEVKSRRMRRGGDIYPEEAVDARKRERYRRIAACYIMDRFPVMSVRFDVVAVSFVSGCEATLDHKVGAFDWEASR